MFEKIIAEVLLLLSISINMGHHSIQSVVVDVPPREEPLKTTRSIPIPYNPKPKVALKIIVPRPKLRTIITTQFIPTGAFSTNVNKARKYALTQIGAVQFNCLDILWNRESHWNPFDLNRSSGAYGIPQAVPGSKMATVGADWQTNPVTQVRWGLGYIHGRYGNACSALQHSNNTGWY